jgi:aspartyl-tRNA(Asn)/glutamyl-tRNA(Gln) amidotransferase subunit A
MPLQDLSGVKLGIAERFFWEGTSPGISERVAEALQMAEGAGARTKELALPATAELFEIYHKGGIVSCELYRFLSSELPAWIETLDPRVRRRMEAGKLLPAWEYLQRTKRYSALAAGAIEALRDVDALVSPTVPISPPPVAELADDEVYMRTNMLTLRNTCVASFLGLCAVTLPCGRDAIGMPVGLQLMGRPGSETRLLAIAAGLERLLQQKQVWPTPGA